jgi:hypothetical protein
VDWNSWLAAVASISSSPVSVPGSNPASSICKEVNHPAHRHGREVRMQKSSASKPGSTFQHTQHRQYVTGVPRRQLCADAVEPLLR